MLKKISQNIKSGAYDQEFKSNKLLNKAQKKRTNNRNKI